MSGLQAQTDSVRVLAILGLALLLTACPAPSGGVKPTIEDFTAVPGTINQGQASTLGWTVMGDAPITLSIDNAVGTVTGQTSKEVSPATTTTYTLTAENSAGEDAETVTVTVNGSQTCVDPVAIPDTNLAQAIRETLGKASGDLTCADMESLTELEANERGIGNLEGLQFANNLIRLELDDNAINDISLLENLTELQILFLQRNDVSDISPLAGLTNLVALIMNGNMLADLSPLANLTNMQYFYVSDNPVGSIEVVANYDGLLELGAGRTGITDLSPIVGKPLIYLWLNGNQSLTDFSAIASMTTLEVLLAGDTGFSDDDMPLLANKSSLQRLQLWANEGVSDTSVLADLSQLTQEIDIGGTSVTDLSPIHGLTELQRLRVYYLGLTDADIEFLRDFNQLEVLNLHGNKLTDIRTLVANSAIGDGDEVNIGNNVLDLSNPSVQADIQALLDRGVDLTYEPQPANIACAVALVSLPGKRFSVNSAGTFLTPEANDPVGPATRILLADLGVAPGDCLGVGRVGAYQAGGTFGDDSLGLIAVFQGPGGFITAENTVPVETVFPECTVSPNNIPEDFDANEPVYVVVPEGAEALLFSTFDCFMGDNSDPNGDYGVDLRFEGP